MSYQVLARRWRPTNFTTVVGQAVVVQALSNALNQKRLHHAYLFSGTRGVGKTTLARIVAKCLSCEQGISAMPCGQCGPCCEIDQGRFADLIEVDAASRTKVEDIRELLDNIEYSPSLGRFKIYLIDEVHMLSNHSFNALLKTLEEPPEHVKFLLATTDPQKLPATVLSRCLQFNLKNLASDVIVKHLQDIMAKQAITAQPLALKLLADAGKGSMRDALSLLDQAIAFGNGKVDVKDVNAMLGIVGQDCVEQLLKALANSDGKQLMAIVDDLAEQSADFYYVLDQLLSLLHRLAMAQIVPAVTTTTLDPKSFAKEDIQLYYQIALIGKRDLPHAPDVQSGFEMILLRMLAFQPAQMASDSNQIMAPNNARTTSKEELKPKASSAAADMSWAEIIDQLAITGLAQALAKHCAIEIIDNERVVLALAEHHATLLIDEQKDKLQQALSQYFNKTISLVIKLQTPKRPTPMEQHHHLTQQQLKQATLAIKSDPKVKDLIATFDAKIEKITSNNH